MMDIPGLHGVRGIGATITPAGITCEPSGNFYPFPQPPYKLRQGDNVWITAFGRTVPAVVLLASGNSHSLMVQFDVMLGGYAGMMAVLWDVGRSMYADLIRCERVTVEPLLPGADFEPDA